MRSFVDKWPRLIFLNRGLITDPLTNKEKRATGACVVSVGDDLYLHACETTMLSHSSWDAPYHTPFGARPRINSYSNRHLGVDEAMLIGDVLEKRNEKEQEQLKSSQHHGTLDRGDIASKLISPRVSTSPPPSSFPTRARVPRPLGWSGARFSAEMRTRTGGDGDLTIARPSRARALACSGAGCSAEVRKYDRDFSTLAPFTARLNSRRAGEGAM